MWRVKPRHSQVNGYWMCDHGREIYKATNPVMTDFVGERGKKKALKRQNRLMQVKKSQDSAWQYLDSADTLKRLQASLSNVKKAALVVTGQYSTQEYQALLGFWKSQFSGENIYHWINHPDKLADFDGLLIRGDKNPNTKGLQQVAGQLGLSLKTDIPNFADFDLAIVAGPENQWVFEDIKEKASLFAKAENVYWMSSCLVPQAEEQKGNWTFIPTKTFAEKSGTFVNHAGVEQHFEKVDLFVDQALSLTEIAHILKGENVLLQNHEHVHRVHNEFIHERGHV